MPFGGKPEKKIRKCWNSKKPLSGRISFSFPEKKALPQERSIKLGGERRKRYSKNNQEKEGPFSIPVLQQSSSSSSSARAGRTLELTLPPWEKRGKKQRAAPRIVVSSLPIFPPFPSSQELPSSAHRHGRAGRKRSDRARRKKGGLLLLLLLRLQHTRVSTEAMAAAAAAAVFFLTAIKSL